MTVKPTQAELAAQKVMEADPDFGRNALEAVVNDCAELRDALLAKGLVEEVK